MTMTYRTEDTGTTGLKEAPAQDAHTSPEMEVER
jgi:hypothetical protein